MAILAPRPEMAFWDIEIGGVEATGLMRSFISGMAFEYSVDGPETAQIQVASESFIEDVFQPGVEVKVTLGWDRLFRAVMINGKIVTSPDGDAREKIGYTVTVSDKAMSMAKSSKNRVFKVPQKTAVVTQILTQNGYIPVVQISDVIPIQPKEMPIQKNETDLNFLYRCAAKWECLLWFDGRTCYFVDASRAHQLGVLSKTFHMGDLFAEYDLNYRTAGSRNNVASVRWKHGKTKGGAPGLPGSTGADEDGTVRRPDDYDIEFEGQFYKLKPAIQERIARNPALSAGYLLMTLAAETSKAREKLREYFVPVTHGSPTQKHKDGKPAHKAGAQALEVELNVGDPFLRAPRVGLLNAGSMTKDSDLPAFLYRDGKPQRYNINKVRTELSTGMIKTKMRMSMGKAA